MYNYLDLQELNIFSGLKYLKYPSRGADFDEKWKSSALKVYYKSSKVATPKKFFSSVYVIDTTCFDKCF